ncbi:TerD family protein [Nocardia asteroides]|uniref:TerD family protein n=1 Tax=Nocardia asteroides TaxID=1824 RepID=UPI001E30C243|nr:TerD family protein [Nocardia asteroides]UGT55653.1 TerD family protein [Nocardia asteroides]
MNGTPPQQRSLSKAPPDRTERAVGVPCARKASTPRARPESRSGLQRFGFRPVFDFGFLASEFDRAGGTLPVQRRLCTLALARRIGLPTPDYTLGTLATYYGVPQVKAHDALDDTRVLAQVLRALVADAARLGIAPPLLDCVPGAHRPPRTDWPRERRGPKPPCPFAYPGRWEPGAPLRQGMKVAFTGETRTERVELVDRAEAAGLEVTGGVSGRTSILVTNTSDDATTKARKARELATPTITETGFMELLTRVEPGQPKSAAPTAASARRRPPATGRLAGKRVLVLGGTHDEATVVRARIVELGGSVAVNLSATVTDLILLAGADADRRVGRATALGLPCHGIELLEPSPAQPAADPPETVATESAVPEPVVLARGHVIDLPVEADTWTVRATWNQLGATEVDLVAFLVDATEKVGGSADFVFYNQPETTGARLTPEGPTEQSVAVSLDDLPEHCTRVVFAAAVDATGVTFGDVGAIELDIAPGLESSTVIRATLDAATVERTLVLAELYLRGDTWRIRAVGQGYEDGLAELARRYGVEVD